MPSSSATTLIIPAYNAAGTLNKTLAELNRLSSDWEILLVDDDSQDGTADLARSLLPRCRVISSPSRKGAAAARNLGVSEASGELLVFLDSDVQVSAATLERLRSRLLKSPQLTGIFGAYCPLGYPGETGLSRFRNLLHCYTHRRHAGLAASFWTGLGALRRSALPSLRSVKTSVQLLRSKTSNSVIACSRTDISCCSTRLSREPT
ncbi:MAG: glycosyltransferase family 2 protein [Vulcanimicrobiota bacterium]